MTRTALRAIAAAELVALACAYVLGALEWQLALLLAGPLYWAAWIAADDG